MAGVYKHNKFSDKQYWIGAQDMPSFDVDVLVDDTCNLNETLSFEICLDDWWPWFTAGDEV